MKVLAILYQGFQAAKEEPRLLGTVENELGLRKWLEDQGHEFVVTGDKEGSESAFQKHIQDAEVLITTPFHPGYLTKELVDKAKNLKMCIKSETHAAHFLLSHADNSPVLLGTI